MTDSPDVANRDVPRAAFGALIGFAVLVGGVTFLLSFHGLDHYGLVLAQLGGLSPLVPLGVDGLTLVAVAATYLLRTAPWRVRLYAWGVFAVAIAASVAGNLSYAASQRLTSQGMVGAAAWPILLALASHMVIVTRRWMERRPRVAIADIEPDTDPGPDQREDAPDPKPFDAQAYARRRAGQGHPVARIGRSLRDRGEDITDRQVARWTEDIRAARSRTGSDGTTRTDDVAEPVTT